MTHYAVYELSSEDLSVLTYVDARDASSPRAAIRAVVPEARDGRKFAAIPTRNITVLTAKTKPATVSWQ